MKLHLDTPGRNRISGYGEGYVTVNHERITTSLLLTPDSMLRDWAPDTLDALEVAHLKTVHEMSPEIILLGTGRTQIFPDAALLGALYAAGRGVEVMDTAAACRTYNILMAEERKVAAALFMITA